MSADSIAARAKRALKAAALLRCPVCGVGKMHRIGQILLGGLVVLNKAGDTS